MARPYRPSGKSEPGGLLRLLLLSVVAAVVTGAVEGVASHLGLNLLIVFPAAIGLVAGGVASAQIKRGKVRAPGSAALFACVAALLGQGVTHYAGYVMWRNQVVEEISAEQQRILNTGELSPEERQEIEAIDPARQLDADLQQEVGNPGFLGYLKVAAGAGVSIGRVGRDDEESAPTLTGVGTWVLWGVEFLIAGLIAFVMAYNRARQPFCELCKAWYGRTDVLAIGSGKKTAIKEVVRAIEAGDFGRALEPEVLGEPAKGVASLVTLDRCATCDEHEPLLSVKLVKESRGKAQTAERHKTLIRPDEARVMLQVVEQRVAEERARAEAQDEREA